MLPWEPKDVDSIMYDWEVASADVWQSINNTFKVPYEVWTQIVYAFGRELRQPYSEVLKMPFYEILLLLDYWKDDMEEKAKRDEKEHKKYEAQMSSMQSSMPSEASMSRMMAENKASFQMPQIPKFD